MLKSKSKIRQNDETHIMNIILKYISQTWCIFNQILLYINICGYYIICYTNFVMLVVFDNIIYSKMMLH